MRNADSAVLPAMFGSGGSDKAKLAPASPGALRHPCLPSPAEAQRKYEDNCDSLHDGSVSEAAENSGEEAGEGALDVEAGEMTDGGEDDYDEDGSHHLVRVPAVRA